MGKIRNMLFNEPRRCSNDQGISKLSFGITSFSLFSIYISNAVIPFFFFHFEKKTSTHCCVFYKSPQSFILNHLPFNLVSPIFSLKFVGFTYNIVEEGKKIKRTSDCYMSVALPNLSWWLWSGKKKDAKLQKGSSLNSSSDLNLDFGVGSDKLKFPAVGGVGGNLGSKPRRGRRKLHNQDKGKIDMEYDVVIVPLDGESSSDYESDASDWSIGWSEPHAHGFLSEDEMDGGFGVLVRCFGRNPGGKRDFRKNNSGNNAIVSELSPADSKKYMEQWLSSLQSN